MRRKKFFEIYKSENGETCGIRLGKQTILHIKDTTINKHFAPFICFCLNRLYRNDKNFSKGINGLIKFYKEIESLKKD